MGWWRKGRSTKMSLLNGQSHDETLSFPLKLLRFRAYKWLKNMTGTEPVHG